MNFGAPQHKNEALESADQALQLLPNYGTALAVKILIHSIDYLKNPPNKIQIRNTINELLLNANSGSDNLVSFETWEYLEMIESSSRFKKYIDMLLIEFKDLMEKMVKRHTTEKLKINPSLSDIQDII